MSLWSQFNSPPHNVPPHHARGGHVTQGWAQQATAFPCYWYRVVMWSRGGHISPLHFLVIGAVSHVTQSGLTRDFQCTSKNMAYLLPWSQILSWLWCEGWAAAGTCSWDGSPHKGKLCQLREFPLDNCRCRGAQEDGRCHSCFNHFNISLPWALGPWRIFLMNKNCNSLSYPRSGTLGPWPEICFVSCLHDAIESLVLLSLCTSET